MVPSRLVEELKQNRPFDLIETEVLLNLARTHQKLRAPMEGLLKGMGLSESTYNVLRILRGAGPQGLPCREIGDRMVTRVPDVTRLLDRLSDAGLVERERGREDRRVVITRITGRGRRLLSDLDGPMDEVQKELLGHMSAAEMRTLSELLEKARNP